MATTCQHQPSVVRSEERTLVRNVHAPMAARVFTGWQLAVWHLGHLAETAELVTSELVTNAVRHGRGDELAIRLERAGGSVMVRVWDSNDRDMPRMQEPQAVDAECGRGLTIIFAVCEDWGCYRVAGGGKITWAMITEGL